MPIDNFGNAITHHYSNRALEGSLRGVANGLFFNLSREVLKALGNQSTAGAGAGAAAMVGLMADGLGNERRRETANKAIANEVRKAILRGYDREVLPRKNRNPQYKNRESRYTGRIRRALASERTYAAGPRQIALINTAVLTAEAAHWARLNFGVEGPRVNIGTSPSVNANLFGQRYDLGFNEGPRPNYRLPQGIFVDAAGTEYPHDLSRKGPGGDAFFPISTLQERPIGGIEPRYFLEYGLREFPKQFRKQYNHMIRDAFERIDDKHIAQSIRDSVRRSGNGQQVSFDKFFPSITN